MSTYLTTELVISAYTSNPTLNAARQELRAVNETLPQALAGYRPNLSSFANAGGAYEFTEDDNPAVATAAAGVTLTQPLYRGGRTTAGVSGAQNRVLSQREIYRDAEQEVLLQAANAHLDVLHDQQILGLARENEAKLSAQLSAFRRQLKAGAATKTDIAQGESRLAQTQAGVAEAEANLAASWALFYEVVGTTAEALKPANASRYIIPANRDEALMLALQNSPTAGAAYFAEIASKFDVDVAAGWSKPQADLVGSVQYFSEAADDLDDEFAAARLELRVTVPLYDGGVYGSQKRQSVNVAAQRRAQLLAARRQVEREANGAWKGWTTAKIRVERLISALEAARNAVDGLREERRLGERTAIDLLDGEQELLSASIALAEAKTSLLSARLQVLASIGAFPANKLELNTRAYDAEADFQIIRDRWF
ncbi:MAG: TolC family outer membrane protein [Geminicoccaceae bacterium]